MCSDVCCVSDMATLEKTGWGVLRCFLCMPFQMWQHFRKPAERWSESLKFSAYKLFQTWQHFWRLSERCSDVDSVLMLFQTWQHFRRPTERCSDVDCINAVSNMLTCEKTVWEMLRYWLCIHAVSDVATLQKTYWEMLRCLPTCSHRNGPWQEVATSPCLFSTPDMMAL